MPVWAKHQLLFLSHLPQAMEAALAVAALALAWINPPFLERWRISLDSLFARAAARKGWCVLGVLVLALALRAALLPLAPPGLPEVHDEFSYLLAADTFASGRLTNPTPAMWRHFETMHVIFQPTHQSKYPPGQGLALAAGMVLGHDPWFGVWISCAVMCAALCWMLQGWLPPPYALLGGLLAVLRFCTVHDWSTGYWGGAVAATGGALLMGALPRLFDKASILHSMLFGAGLVILANSRPFEGAVLGAMAVLVLLVWLVRQKTWPVRRVILRVALPLALVLASGAWLTTSYFKAVTGSRFTMPYQLHIQTYEAARPFLWQAPDLSKTYAHGDLKKYWRDYHLQRAENAKKNLSAVAERRIVMTWFDLLWPGLAWPLLFLPWAMTARRNRLLAFFGISILAVMATVAQFYTHYLAPMAGVLLALILVGMQRMQTWTWKGKPLGMALSRLTVLAWLMVPVLLIITMQTEAQGILDGRASPFRFQRANMEKRLEQAGGKHLVIVRYGPDHSVFEEWVYNRADLDKAPVIWARDMGKDANKELMDYYPDRKDWLLEVNGASVGNLRENVISGR